MAVSPPVVGPREGRRSEVAPQQDAAWVVVGRPPRRADQQIDAERAVVRIARLDRVVERVPTAHPTPTSISVPRGNQRRRTNTAARVAPAHADEPRAGVVRGRRASRF